MQILWFGPELFVVVLFWEIPNKTLHMFSYSLFEQIDCLGKVTVKTKNSLKNVQQCKPLLAGKKIEIESFVSGS